MLLICHCLRPEPGDLACGWDSEFSIRSVVKSFKIFEPITFVTFQVIFDHLSMQEELGQTLTELKSEKQNVETENKLLRAEAEVAALKQASE